MIAILNLCPRRAPTPVIRLDSGIARAIFCLPEPLYSELVAMDGQIKRVVSYYRTTYRRGDKAGSVLLRTVEEIKRVVSYYRTTYRRGDKAGSVLLSYYRTTYRRGDKTGSVLLPYYVP